MGTQHERLQLAVGDRYRIDREIGRGGMATVFVAEDLKHPRRVAIKVLDESLSQTIALPRFRREIEVIARLQHPHLLTLIDSGDVEGLPFYVMPYIEAQSLRELIAREKRLSVERVLTIAGEIADGLAYAHEHGVLHRDIKPSNILMSGGHAIIADFGIATALENAGAGRITETGVSTGSPVYMSPEQAAGERDLDARSDVYSLGCVVYEMLCGVPPVDDDSMQRVITRKLNGQYRPLREARPDVPAALDAAVDRALATSRDERHASIRDFADALGSAMPESRGRRPRSRLRSAAIVAVLLLVAFAGQRYSRLLAATRELPELDRLASAGQFAAAFELAQRLAPTLREDSTFQALAPRYSDFLRVVTTPAGARVSRRRIGDAEGRWEPVGRTPLDSLPMPKFGRDLSFLLRIELPGHRPVEVLPSAFATWALWRGIRPLDTLRLDPIDDGNDGFVRVPGWSAADDLHPGTDSLRFSDFHIARTEVTNAEYARFVADGGYRERKYWTEAFVRDGRTLTFEEAMTSFRDQSGAPGPSTWSGGTYPEGQADHPVGGVSFYEAAAYARYRGARLPTSAHWGRAATRHQREEGWITIPASNLSAAAPRPVGQGVQNAYGLFDFAGNVREWCVNPVDDGRLTRGGGWTDAEFLVGHLVPKPEFDRAASNGIRLMRTTDADSTLAHVSQRIARTVVVDHTRARPVGDAEFAVYRGLFQYDPTPLAPVLLASGVTEQYRWEKVGFTAPTPGPQMEAYLFFPRTGNGPFPPVIYWGSSGILQLRSIEEPFTGVGWSMAGEVGTSSAYLLQSGRAIVVPLIWGAFERDDSLFSVRSHGQGETQAQRELWIRWIRETRRTVDLIAEHPELIGDQVAYVGYSWGSQMAPMFLAVEPRIRAAVLNTGGLWMVEKPLPELSMVNYLPRVRTPVLMLNGRYDVIFPYETSQLPFLRLLGTPVPDKRHVVYPSAHSVPAADNARETLAWLDKYVGRPSGPP